MLPDWSISRITVGMISSSSTDTLAHSSVHMPCPMQKLLGPHSSPPGVQKAMQVPSGPQCRFSPQSVVLMHSSPHSGSNYPVDFNHVVPTEKLRRAEDMYVDELFGSAPACG